MEYRIPAPKDNPDYHKTAAGEVGDYRPLWIRLAEQQDKQAREAAKAKTKGEPKNTCWCTKDPYEDACSDCSDDSVLLIFDY